MVFNSIRCGVFFNRCKSLCSVCYDKSTLYFSRYSPLDHLMSLSLWPSLPPSTAAMVSDFFFFCRMTEIPLATELITWNTTGQWANYASDSLSLSVFSVSATVSESLFVVAFYPCKPLCWVTFTILPSVSPVIHVFLIFFDDVHFPANWSVMLSSFYVDRTTPRKMSKITATFLIVEEFFNWRRDVSFLSSNRFFSG